MPFLRREAGALEGFDLGVGSKRLTEYQKGLFNIRGLSYDILPECVANLDKIYVKHEEMVRRYGL